MNGLYIGLARILCLEISMGSERDSIMNQSLYRLSCPDLSGRRRFLC
jgi:hypothetical protein